MTAPREHQHVLDLAWMAERAADITYLMQTIGTAPDIEAIEEQREEIARVVKAITRRFGERMAYIIVKRIERVTGKLELPKEE